MFSMRDMALMLGPLFFVMCLYLIFKGFRGFRIPDLWTKPNYFTYKYEAPTWTTKTMYKKITHKDGKSITTDLTKEEKEALNQEFKDLEEEFAKVFDSADKNYHDEWHDFDETDDKGHYDAKFH